MKNIIAIVLLAVIADASYWDRSNNYFGSAGVPGFQRYHRHGHFHSRHHPFDKPDWHDDDDSSESNSNDEWICRNSKTGVTVIIDTTHHVGETGAKRPPHHSPHYPHGNREWYHGHNPHTWENSYPDPISTTLRNNINQESVNTHTTEIPRTTSPESQTERTNGGEGLIDIRIGEEERK